MKNIQELPTYCKERPGFLSCSISEDGEGQYKGQKMKVAESFWV